MALIRLLPEQAAKFWPEIKPIVGKALPPTAHETFDGMLGVLNHLITGRLHCWLIVDEESRRLNGVFTTSVIPDPITGQRSLLLYSVSSVDGLEIRPVVDSFKKLLEFAKSVGCQKVIAYTANAKIVSLMKKLGWSTEFVFGSYSIY